jgi:hypothetical protein
MVAASQFAVYRLQVSMFSSTEELRPAFALRHALRKEWSAEYDATPTSIQLPPGLPPEIPEVTLSNESGSRRLEIARERVNLVRENRVGEDEFSIKESIGELAERGWEIFESQRLSIGRLAVVTVRFVRVEDPGMVLAQHYFDKRWLDAPFNRPSGLEIHAHKVLDLRQNLPVNSWVRVRTGMFESDAYNAVAVEQDINSLEAERRSRSFDHVRTKEFFDLVAMQFDEILNLYFPENEG